MSFNHIQDLIHEQSVLAGQLQRLFQVEGAMYKPVRVRPAARGFLANPEDLFGRQHDEERMALLLLDL